jgi:putative glutamine amidotransferase
MRIGIPMSESNTQYYINQAYVSYVVESGMSPVLITPGNNVAEILELCDGLLLPGGIDLDPTYY